MSAIGKTSQLFAARDPDVRLMLRIRGDDPGAFQEFVEKYQHRLLAIMTHLTGSSDAEDLTQEVFLRVFRSRNTYHPQAKFSTWLFTIANNVALNSHRTRKRKPTRQFNPSLSQSGGYGASCEEAGVPDDAPAPDHRLHHHELASAVAEALTKLNDRQRTAVILSKFEELSYQEIGEILGISEKAVKSLLARAREQLKEILRKYVEQDVSDSQLQVKE